MSTLRQVLDVLISAGVIVEATDDGRLRLKALFESRPIEGDVRDLCREHKQMLIEYLRFAREADQSFYSTPAPGSEQPGLKHVTHWNATPAGTIASW